MTYAELLLDLNWQAKKKEIITRDALKCTVCNNENIFYDSLRGLLFFHGENYQGKLFGFYGHNSKGELINHKVFIRKELHLIPFHSDKGHVVYIERSSENQLFARMLAVREREAEDYQELEHDLNHSPIKTWGCLSHSANHAAYNWKVVPGLHVHHLYYQKNLMPWEYPSEALQTVCWDCHEKFHQDRPVPYLNEAGQPIRSLTPCGHCYGAGLLPSYRHLEAGICPRCNGARYEELIKLQPVHLNL